MSVQNKETSVTKPRNLLLSVTGMSPAVVTETLYGIAQRQQKGIDSPWPDEIRIITTKTGKATMEKGLILGDWLRKVCEEVGMPVVELKDEHILVVPDANGVLVEDARSEEDHEALADFITKTVRDYTRENDYRIHASIAGGRKTMTFYLGYAMSLFGRHFDRMSHVLVSDGYEGEGFFFPNQRNQEGGFELIVRSKPVDSRKAVVTLADIPFIRMRHNLPKVLTDAGVGSTELDYRNLVDLINLGDQPERLHIRVNSRNCSVQIFDEDCLVKTVDFTGPLAMAFYMLFVEDTLRPAEERKQFSRPGKGVEDEVLLEMLFARLSQMAGKPDEGSIAEQKAMILDARWPGEKDTPKYPNLDRSLSALDGMVGLTGTKFTNLLSEVSKQFERELPKHMADLLTPKPMFNDDGEIVQGRTSGCAYGISLNPEQITVVN